MSRWLVLPMFVMAWLAAPVATALAHDRDHDGLNDRWERRHGLSTHKRSATGDPDHDGLTNRREYRLHTNPRRRDTDRDGLRDGAEVKRYHTNPRKKDTDGDGLNDRAEIKRYHTNPHQRDTDGDGVSDGAEVRAGTDPRDRSSHPPVPGAPSPGPSPARPGGFPTPSTTGVPAGWAPAQTRTSDLHVTQAGAVVQDVLLQNASIIVEAPNVTIRRVKLQGGRISNFNGSPCQGGMVIEDTTIEPPPGQINDVDTEGVIEVGGYTARRVKIWRRSEGFRSGANCGQIRVEDSFESIVIPPGRCDLHSDGIQGYHGPWTTMVNTTIDFREANCGTAPFFFPKNQGNTGVTVDGLLVMGGGYPFRLGVPGTVRGLRIVNDSWGYGPINVLCSAVTSWEASIVTVTSDYQVASTVRSQPCNTQDGI